MNLLRVITLSAFIAGGFAFNSVYGQINNEGVKGFIAKPLEIHGNFSVRGQYYQEDSAIGAPDVPEKFLMNGFANVIVTKGAFSAGVRYEGYRNPILGFDQRYKRQRVSIQICTV